MPKTRLTQHRVDALKPQGKTLDVRDTVIRGFGVRVLPSGGKHFFLHSQTDGRRVWQSIGDAQAMSLECARERAASLLASRFRHEGVSPTAGAFIPFEVVAEEVFRRYRRHWKPRTLNVNLCYLRRQILPWFKRRSIGEITRNDVQRWFASLRATPVAADRSAPVLSVILRQAEVYGYRPEGTNPCTGIRRYRRRGRERCLSHDEIRRLIRVLDGKHKKRPLLAAVVRLLLFTGCRKSEILTLRWSDYREGKLYLADSKTGPRTVWLSSPARRVLDRLPRRHSWVFPSPRGKRHLSAGALARFWYGVREEAGIGDVRLHDLRHTYASVALAHGETVLTIGRLLGHNDPATTLKYTHLADASVHEASESLVPVLNRTG
ncbi:MAG: tyrosine-type recombinase/integrase [bacterium]|nr:tyrosine-type recombinase/integrase [bacterium]